MRICSTVGFQRDGHGVGWKIYSQSRSLYLPSQGFAFYVLKGSWAFKTGKRDDRNLVIFSSSLLVSERSSGAITKDKQFHLLTSNTYVAPTTRLVSHGLRLEGFEAGREQPDSFGVEGN